MKNSNKRFVRLVYQDVARLDVSVNDLVLLAKVAEAAQNLKVFFIHRKKAINKGKT